MKHTNRLRVLRAEKRITQMKLATRARIDVTRYWKIENGYVEPTDTERERISRLLGVQPSDAFPGVAA